MALSAPPPPLLSAKYLSFGKRKFWMEKKSESDFISALPFHLPKEIINTQKHLDALLEFRERVYVELEAVNDYTALQNGLLFPHIDHSTLVRFLKARKYDVEEAFKQLASYISFRVTEIPENSVQASEIEASLHAGKVHVLKYPDRQGNVCLVVSLSKHHMRDVNASETERFIVYCFDKIISKILTGKRSMTKLTIFGNLKGVGWSNLDVSCSKRLFTLMQNYFPERLAFMLNWCPPAVFAIAHKIVMPFVDPNTRSKIAMTNDPKDLSKHFDLSKLPCSLGGTGSEDLLIPIENVTKGAVLFEE